MNVATMFSKTKYLNREVVFYMLKEVPVVQELNELDKKHFIHPTSSISQQQENGPSFIFTEGKGIYLTDITGKKSLMECHRFGM